MIVMKFGGASVKDAPSVRNVLSILSLYLGEKTMVVISAMDKTTNELEQLAWAAEAGNKEKAQAHFSKIQNFHHNIIQDLFAEDAETIKAQIAPYLQEIHQIVEGILLLGEFPALTYDRIVAYGELLSTRIVASYVEKNLGYCQFMDARNLIKTDTQYGQANVLWSVSEELIQSQLTQIEAGKLVITQGFIASTLGGKTTTLGREGSDYTAAILAHCLNADKMIVWKDVAGVLSADPKKKADAVKIDFLSYQEAVEMTFYGATVIHPKTIQPLFNKNIPLWVKSFKNPQAEGTLISAQADQKNTPTFISKGNQRLISIRPRDFSFMEEGQLQRIFQLAQYSGLKPNLVQTSSLSLYLCTDDKANSWKMFESELIEKFSVESETGLTLETHIHPAFELVTEIQKEGILTQIFPDKICVVKRIS